MAGIAGVDPDPHTLRELVLMADGVRRDEWDRASLLAAIQFNRGRKRQHQRTPEDFNPFHRRRRRGHRITPANIADLKVLL